MIFDGSCCRRRGRVRAGAFSFVYTRRLCRRSSLVHPSPLCPELVAGPHSLLLWNALPGSPLQSSNGRQHVRPDYIASSLPILIPSSLIFVPLAFNRRSSLISFTPSVTHLGRPVIFYPIVSHWRGAGSSKFFPPNSCWCSALILCIFSVSFRPPSIIALLSPLLPLPVPASL